MADNKELEKKNSAQAEELDFDDLEKVSGGSLRDVPKRSTGDVSSGTKSKLRGN